MNPPFHDSARTQASPDAARRTAHVAAAGSIAAWAGAAAYLLRPAGMLTLIYRADGLGGVLGALARDFEAVGVLAVYSKPGAPPIRVIVQASRRADDRTARDDLHSAAAKCEGALILADSGGKPTAEAEAILRDAAPLRIGG